MVSNTWVGPTGLHHFYKWAVPLNDTVSNVTPHNIYKKLVVGIYDITSIY